MAGMRIRLQDLIAALLAALFGLGLGATAFHLAERYGELADRATNARERFGELVDLAKTGIAPHTVTLIEGEIDAKQRDRRAQEEAIAAGESARQRAEKEKERLRQEAKEQGVTGLGPFDPGPEPKTWYPRFINKTWWKWKAKAKAVDVLNGQYYKHEETMLRVKGAVAEATRAIKAIDADITRLRDLKNQTIEILHDQSKRDELAEAIRQSTAAMTIAFLLHIPIALYFSVLFVRAVFRLAILREWFGDRRLCRAH